MKSFICLFLFVQFNFLWAQPALWKIEDTNIYLLGSIHVADSSLYPLPKYIEVLMDSSQFLAVETDISSLETQSEVSQFMFSLMGSKSIKLNDQIKEKEHDLLKKIATKYEFHDDILLPLPTWLAAIQLSQIVIDQLGYDPNYGIDNHFLTLAKEANKEIISLESATSALSIFAKLDDKMQYALFCQSLAEIDSMKILFGQIIDSYKEGNIETLEKLLNEDRLANPELLPLNEALLFERNKIMAKGIIEQIEKTKKGLVIVGSAHLIGEKSVIEILTSKGYKVNRVSIH